MTERSAAATFCWTLNDDVLLQILSYCDHTDLVRSCRAVSHQWQNVSLHPQLWRDYHLRVVPETSFMTRAVLLLTPRAAHLEVISPGVLLKKAVADVAFATRCAVESVSFRVTKTSGLGTVNFLRQQGHLGRLRHLKLEFYVNANLEEGLDMVQAVSPQLRDCTILWRPDGYAIKGALLWNIFALTSSLGDTCTTVDMSEMILSMGRPNKPILILRKKLLLLFAHRMESAVLLSSILRLAVPARYPVLRKLTLNVLPDPLLDPDALPGLQELVVVQQRTVSQINILCPQSLPPNLNLLTFQSFVCSSTSCSLPAFRALSRRNPQLHVFVIKFFHHLVYPAHHDNRLSCECCRLHPGAAKPVGFYSHPADVACAVKEHNLLQGEWM